MKNPFMAMWLSTVSSSLRATRAFWASILHRHGPAEEGNPPRSVEPDASARKPPEGWAAEPVEGKAPETHDPSAAGQGGASGEAQTSPSKRPTAPRADTVARKKPATGGRRERAGKPSKVAAKRATSREEPKSRSPAAAKPDASDAKYRNPDDPSQTWSGRGRRPRWLSEALEAGRKLEDLQAGKR